MHISLGLPVVLCWILLAAVPVRNASARRLWIGIYAGASLLILLVAFIYCADDRSGDSADTALDQYLLFIIAAAAVGPGLLVVLIRLVVSRPDPAPPVVQYLPPQQHYAPYTPPYGQQPYPPAQQQAAPQSPPAMHPVPPVPPAAPPPPTTPPAV